MRPNINVLEGGVAVTREMTGEEYEAYLEMLRMAQSGEV